jgi:DNA mismatch repair ATPase MutS
MSYFSWIADGLRLDDKPGKMSMFEREVSFASHILSKKDGCGLVLYDELFHSTNPPDALFCSKTFLGDFWRYETVTSIISTHSFELLNSLPQCVKPICCPAEEDPLTRKIKYTYRVEPGICRLSSVREVLAEAGFLA